MPTLRAGAVVVGTECLVTVGITDEKGREVDASMTWQQALEFAQRVARWSTFAEFAGAQVAAGTPAGRLIEQHIEGHG